MERAVCRERFETGLSALLALGSASGLDGDTLAECLTVATAYLLASMMIHNHRFPEEFDQVLSVYSDNLRVGMLTIIHDHATGR